MPVTPPVAVASTAILILTATAPGDCARSGSDREASNGEKAGGTPSRQSAVGTAETYTDIKAGQLREMLASEDLVLVNVHIPHEEDIPGTDLSILYDEIADPAGELPDGKDARIVLYCQSGHMSAEAARSLVSLGFMNVLNLRGGLLVWVL